MVSTLSSQHGRRWHKSWNLRCRSLDHWCRLWREIRIELQLCEQKRRKKKAKEKLFRCKCFLQFLKNREQKWPKLRWRNPCWITRVVLSREGDRPMFMCLCSDSPAKMFTSSDENQKRYPSGSLCKHLRADYVWLSDWVTVTVTVTVYDPQVEMADLGDFAWRWMQTPSRNDRDR